MELKSHLGIIRSLRTVGSNRTFMELKYRSSLKSIRLRPSSNRTFMELKLGTRTAGTFASSVLIAPLWNWNDLFSLSFLTLKLVLIAPLWNWNPSARTFSSEENAVLIAPLWNWNGLLFAAFWGPLSVLIAPLWNWNFIVLIGTEAVLSF